MDDLAMMCAAEHPRLVGMLALYCGDRDVAEDLAQEALVRLCRDWRRVRKLARPEAWLHRVGINLAHSHYRRKAIETKVKALLRGRTVDADILPHDVESLELLKPLPHRQRAALLLHYYLDMTVRDVAELMEIPEATAKTLIHRGSQRLRADTSASEARDVS